MQEHSKMESGTRRTQNMSEQKSIVRALVGTTKRASNNSIYLPESPMKRSFINNPKMAQTTIFGGNKFHSGTSVYNYGFSTHHNHSKSIGLSPVKNTPASTQYTKNTIKTMHKRNTNIDIEKNMKKTIQMMRETKLNPNRPQHHFKQIEPTSDEEADGPELFIAQPTDDIPRNKLVEKLARGL